MSKELKPSSPDMLPVKCKECGHVHHLAKHTIIVRSRQIGRTWRPRCDECGLPLFAYEREMPVEPLPCPFCGGQARTHVAEPGGPYPGGYFEICCTNDDCPVGPCLSEKHRTDLRGMSHSEAEAVIWPGLIAKWNIRHKTT